MGHKALIPYLPKDVDTVDIFLDPIKTPHAYNSKLKELVEEGEMTEEEAKKYIDGVPFTLEVYNHYGYGIFAMDSEAVGCCDMCSPYTGERYDGIYEGNLKLFIKEHGEYDGVNYVYYPENLCLDGKEVIGIYVEDEMKSLSYTCESGFFNPIETEKGELFYEKLYRILTIQEKLAR